MAKQNRAGRRTPRAGDEARGELGAVDAAGSSGTDRAIDELYQLPLDQFVAARTQLARGAAGAEAAGIRALPKPNVIAWALNQLYWSAKPTFDRLVAAAARLRASQAEALMGRASDLRSADAAHREAMRSAIEQATNVLGSAGHAATPDTVRALTAALEALPWKEHPGRLARPPVAPGFAAFEGLPIAPAARPPEPAPREPEATAVGGTSAGGTTAGGTSVGGTSVGGSLRAPDKRPAASSQQEVAAERRARAEERERAERLREARTRLEDTRQAATKAAARASAADQRAASARDAERQARERLDRARRELREAEAERREAGRAELAARAAVREAEEALARLER